MTFSKVGLIKFWFNLVRKIAPLYPRKQGSQVKKIFYPTFIEKIHDFLKGEGMGRKKGKGGGSNCHAGQPLKEGERERGWGVKESR